MSDDTPPSFERDLSTESARACDWGDRDFIDGLDHLVDLAPPAVLFAAADADVTLSPRSSNPPPLGHLLGLSWSAGRGWSGIGVGTVAGSARRAAGCGRGAGGGASSSDAALSEPESALASASEPMSLPS